MKNASFKEKCRFEIGDKVRHEKSGAVYTVTDIACTNYVREGEVEYRYELNNSGLYQMIRVSDGLISEKEYNSLLELDGW